jgi:AcrR family transcriptional regulator
VSPRASAAAAARTRAAVVAETVDLASTGGLETISIGRLAESLEMSKAGVIGPFGSKEKLQLAALEEAATIYRRELWERAETERPGLPRLRAIAAAWLSYLERDVFPGGCFMTQVAAEFDGRPGAVRDAIAHYLDVWDSVIQAEVRTALERGELPDDADPAQVAFEMNGIAQGVNQARQLRRDPEAVERGRRAMESLLGPLPAALP